MKLNLLLTISFLLICSAVFSQNLLPTENVWIDGRSTANIPPFIQGNGTGGTDQNIIENGLNPFEQESGLWKVQPNTTSPSWIGFRTNNFDSFSIDINEDYRFSIWVKIINDEGGRFISMFRGTGSPVYEFSSFDNSATNRDAYFRSGGNMPENDKWFLMVGYISGVNGTQLYNDSGFHDLQGNVTPLGTNQMRFNSAMDVQFQIINYLHNRTNVGYNVANIQNLLFFDPRFEKVTGAPSIQNLLNNSTSILETEGQWSENSNGIHYNSGNVGIGTDDPGDLWKLAVNGSIRSHEIKVETTNWPDYVFSKEYKLPTLEEIQQHITEKGHLPDIPSAVEAETKGIELGEMNRLLLKKIEELTLYTLQQQKDIKKLILHITNQEQRISELEKHKE